MNKRVLHFGFDFVHIFFFSELSFLVFFSHLFFSLCYRKAVRLLLLLLIPTSTVIVVVCLLFRFPHQSSYAGLDDSMVELMEQGESESTNKNQTSISSLFMHRNIFHSQNPYSSVFSFYSPTPYCVLHTLFFFQSICKLSEC